MSKPTAACFATCKPITGTTEAHCPAKGCHQSFYLVEDFDKHRYDPDLPEDQDNTCWEPSSVGLILEDGLWSTEAGHAKRAFVNNRLAKAREVRSNGKA